MGDIIARALALRNRRRLDAIDPHTIYGVSWSKGESPILMRTDAAVGMTANAGIDNQTVHNDFDDAGIYRDIIEVTDSLGNVFMRIPKFYIRKTDATNSKTWQISQHRHKGFYLPWCFWDFATNRELPYIDVGKYNASLSDAGLLESKPDTYPLVSTTIVSFRNYARANNSGGLRGYQQMDIHVYDVLSTLFYVEFATLNSQAIMQGWTSGQYNDSHTAAISEDATNRIVVADSVAGQYRVVYRLPMRDGNMIEAYIQVVGLEGL